MDERDKLHMPLEVNFSCQRCCQPLRLHSTLNSINKETYLDLIPKKPSKSDATDDGNKAPETDEEKFVEALSSPSTPSESKPRPDVSYKTIRPLRANAKFTDCDYSLINDPNAASNSITSSLLSGFDQLSNESHKGKKDLKLQIQLFDILSDQSDIDHPLCEECADFVIEQMDKQLSILEEECNEYNQYLSTLENDTNETTTEDEIESLKSKLKEMEGKQTSMIGQLKSLNKEQKQLDDQLEHFENELRRLKVDEEKYWNEYNSVKFNYFQCEEELRTLENKIRYANEFNNKLKRTSIFNMAFCIWHTGPFGTINGFRLGRLPDVQVDWHEINAGLGQCALLLTSLAKRVHFTFQHYKIVPYGNFSFIESLEDKSKQLPLYNAGGIKYYFHQKFDQAMIAFLYCLLQFYNEIQRQDVEFKLPYEMDNRGNIYEKSNSVKLSVKININTEEQWTKALKFMLTNLKWALAWVVNKYPDHVET